MSLIRFTENGLYCQQGNFYIDPWRPVDKAVITHAHSDHARWGSQSYLCHSLTRPLLELRLGTNHYQTAEWNEPIWINGVKLSLHPAGHIIGSSQIRLEYKGEIWVVSGDYKTENDGISGSFEPVKCHHFVTESTFGLPVYQWKKQEEIYASIRNWVSRNQQEGYSSVLIAYSLGKAQRIISCLAGSGSQVYAHGAIANTQEKLIGAGIPLDSVSRVDTGLPKQAFKKSIVIAPPSAEGSSWLQRFAPYRTAICSGWMQVRGNMRRRNADAGFALSDHADWPGLIQAVKATGASQVYVTHGFQSVFSRYLNEQGIMASEVSTAFGSEEENETPMEDKPGSHNE